MIVSDIDDGLGVFTPKKDNKDKPDENSLCS